MNTFGDKPAQDPMWEAPTAFHGLAMRFTEEDERKWATHLLTFEPFEPFLAWCQHIETRQWDVVPTLENGKQSLPYSLIGEN